MEIRFFFLFLPKLKIIIIRGSNTAMEEGKSQRLSRLDKVSSALPYPCRYQTFNGRLKSQMPQNSLIHCYKSLTYKLDTVRE